MSFGARSKARHLLQAGQRDPGGKLTVGRFLRNVKIREDENEFVHAALYSASMSS